MKCTLCKRAKPRFLRTQQDKIHHELFQHGIVRRPEQIIVTKKWNKAAGKRKDEGSETLVRYLCKECGYKFGIEKQAALKRLECFRCGFLNVEEI